jgi:hypothetical protein
LHACERNDGWCAREARFVWLHLHACAIAITVAGSLAITLDWVKRFHFWLSSQLPGHLTPAFLLLLRCSPLSSGFVVLLRWISTKDLGDNIHINSAQGCKQAPEVNAKWRLVKRDENTLENWRLEGLGFNWWIDIHSFYTHSFSSALYSDPALRQESVSMVAALTHGRRVWKAALSGPN